MYYDNNSGNTYQFNEDNGTYQWEKIESSLMSEILSMANAARDTADNKRRVFVNQPVPPYETGDLWLDNGDLYVCQIAKAYDETFSSSDFIIATKYTDDTIALTAKQTAELAEEKALDVEATANSLKLNFDKRIILDDSSVVDEKYSTITFEDGAIKLAAGDSIIKLVMDNDSIEFQDDSGNVIASWSAINGTTRASELLLGNFAFIPRENGSLGFRKKE